MFEKSSTAEDGRACAGGEDIPAYLQAELAPDRKADFERHLESCATCRARVDSFTKVFARMREVPAPGETRDLGPEILAKIPPAEWIPARRWPVLRLYMPALARAAAALFLVAVLYVALRGKQGSSPIVADNAVQPAGDSAVPRRNEAIAGGLAWLAANQEPDGSWSAEKWGARKDHTVGITALSLMAFIGRDGRPAKGQYETAIRRGIAYLVSQQDAGGRIGPVCDNAMYNHGMATVALLKAIRFYSDKAWKDAGDRAVDFVCAAQNDSGGWGYVAGGAKAANTSVTVWQLQSLMLAESMGRTDLASRIDRSMNWLRGMAAGVDHMGYLRDGESSSAYETLTAAGILCLVADNSGMAKEGGRVAQLVKSIESAAGRQGKDVDYYRWYFVTHALQAAGGRASKEVAGNLQSTLIAQQSSKGPGAGSWELGDRWSPAGGRIYATSMAVLSLE